MPSARAAFDRRERRFDRCGGVEHGTHRIGPGAGGHVESALHHFEQARRLVADDRREAPRAVRIVGHGRVDRLGVEHDVRERRLHLVRHRHGEIAAALLEAHAAAFGEVVCGADRRERERGGGRAEQASAGGARRRPRLRPWRGRRNGARRPARASRGARARRSRASRGLRRSRRQRRRARPRGVRRRSSFARRAAARHTQRPELVTATASGSSAVINAARAARPTTRRGSPPHFSCTSRRNRGSVAFEFRVLDAFREARVAAVRAQPEFVVRAQALLVVGVGDGDRGEQGARRAGRVAAERREPRDVSLADHAIGRIEASGENLLVLAARDVGSFAPNSIFSAIVRKTTPRAGSTAGVV